MHDVCRYSIYMHTCIRMYTHLCGKMVLQTTMTLNPAVKPCLTVDFSLRLAYWVLCIIPKASWLVEIGFTACLIYACMHTWERCSYGASLICCLCRQAKSPPLHLWFVDWHFSSWTSCSKTQAIWVSHAIREERVLSYESWKVHSSALAFNYMIDHIKLSSSYIPTDKKE